LNSIIYNNIDKPRIPNKIMKTYNLDIDQYRILLTKIKRMLRAILLDHSRFVEDLLLSVQFGDESLVYKQFLKQDENTKTLWLRWLEKYKNDFLEGKMERILKRELSERQKLYDILIKIFSFQSARLGTDLDILRSSKLTTYLLEINALFLDVYFLLRVFKPKVYLSDLTISYFGDMHTSHINYFLTDIMGLYDIEIIKKFDRSERLRSRYENKGVEKCIVFKKTINLNKILENKLFSNKTKGIKRKLDSEKQSEIKSEIKTKKKPKIKLESQSKIKLESQPQIKLETQSKIKLESQPQIKLESQPQIKLETQPQIIYYCPPGKILNPRTGKCVKIDGRIGRSILGKNYQPKKETKDCPPGKILNPSTGRCVKKDGKIGKIIVKQKKYNYPS